MAILDCAWKPGNPWKCPLVKLLIRGSWVRFPPRSPKKTKKFAFSVAGCGFALRAERRRFEPGAEPHCVVDDDRAPPAFDQAFALHRVDLARHGLAARIDARGELRLVRGRENDRALRILAIGTG